MHFNDNLNAQNAIRFINGTNTCVFLTGKAGTGKTTLLKYIVEHTHKNTVILAPTGIAALNASGATIHSFFQLPFGSFVPADSLPFIGNLNFEIHTMVQLLKKLQLNAAKRNIIRQMELLVIDEVSMLRADILDAIDTVMRSVRRQKNMPFGGVQVLFIGDMLQLPPIVKDEEWSVLQSFYKSMYFFDALVFQNQKPIIIELEKIYRQADAKFIGILNNLRNNIITSEDITVLNSYYKPSFVPPTQSPYIYITTHNKKAEAINAEKLDALATKQVSFTPLVTGDFSEHLYPLDVQLVLKVGAQVMFVKNDYSGGANYYNGKIGTITSIENDEVLVEFSDTGKVVKAEKYTWENKRFTINQASGNIEEDIIGTYTQFPLKLAWAVTVHKSQGLTFSHAIIDVSEAFAPGQIYVALSRLQTLDGLVLTEPLSNNIPEQHRRLLQYTTDILDQKVLDEKYSAYALDYLKSSTIDAFNLQMLQQEFQYHLDSYTKDKARSHKQNYLLQIKELYEVIPDIVRVSQKFQAQLQQLFLQQVELNQILDRINSAIAYFEPLLHAISKSLFDILDDLVNEKGVKSYSIEVKNLEVLFFNRVQRMKKCVLLIEAMQKNELMQKNMLIHEKDQQFRLQKIQATATKKSTKKSKTSKQSHKDTRPTREITFELFNSGLGISDIATERNLTKNTILNHILFYIADGMIDARDVISKAQIVSISGVIKRLKTKSLSEIKDACTIDVEYNEIKIVLAHLEYLNQLPFS